MDYNMLIIGLLVLIAGYVVIPALLEAAADHRGIAVLLALVSGGLALAGAIFVIVLLAAAPSVGLSEESRPGDTGCLPVLADTSLGGPSFDSPLEVEEGGLSADTEVGPETYRDACDRERDNRVAITAVLAPLVIALAGVSLYFRIRARLPHDPPGHG